MKGQISLDLWSYNGKWFYLSGTFGVGEGKGIILPKSPRVGIREVQDSGVSHTQDSYVYRSEVPRNPSCNVRFAWKMKEIVRIFIEYTAELGISW